MRARIQVRKTVIAAVATLALVTGACAGSGDNPNPGPELPAGTELGEWGGTLKTGESILLVLGDKAGGTSGSLVRLQVLEVRQGAIEDLDSFTGVPPGDVPWFASVSVHNRGPDDVPLADENGWYLRLASDLEVPPTQVQGHIKNCPSDATEETLPAAAERLDCLVFLVPQNERPASVDYVRNNGTQVVAWRVSANATNGS